MPRKWQRMLMLLVLLPAIVQPQIRSLHQSPPQAVPGEVIIKFKNINAPATAAASLQALGLTVRKSIPPLAMVVGKFSPERNLEEVIQACRALPNVEYVEPDYFVYSLNPDFPPAQTRTSVANFPDDPQFSQQWSLHNNDDHDIDAPEAWDITTGSEQVIVGIIDTGIEYDHEELKENLWYNPGETGNGRENNNVDDDNNGYVDDWRGWDFANDENDPADDNGHGTFAAGIIGAKGNNSRGLAGINWQVRLMPLKFLNANGGGSTAGAIEAIIYAASNGAKVLNNGWGGGSRSAALEDAIKYALAQGVLFVATAGNSSNNNDVAPVYPANYDLPNVVAVASSNRQDNLTSTSNYGQFSVDIAAPGESILSTSIRNGYQVLRGATPQVSGVCALVWARFPEASFEEVLIRVLGGSDRTPAFAGLVRSNGRLNAAGALSDKPIIAFTTEKENTTDLAGPYEIHTTVVDDKPLQSVRLLYWKDEKSADSLDMAATEKNLYSASIPGQPRGSVVYYMIVARDQEGNVASSPFFSFEINSRPPAAPAAPALQIIYDPLSFEPVLVWESVPGAVVYRISILDSLRLHEFFGDLSPATDFELSFLPDGVWHARVRATDSLLNTSFWSPSHLGERFMVDTTPPTAPILFEAEIVTPNIRTLRWQPATDRTSGVARYKVELSLDRDFITVFPFELSAAFTQITMPLGDGEWYWRVTAIDEFSRSNSSQPDSFVIDTNAPDTPVFNLQSFPKITNNAQPSFFWNEVKRAVAYEINLANDRSFSLSFADTINAPVYALQSPLPDGTWYIRIRSLNASAAASSWSPTAAGESFVIDTKPPTEAKLAGIDKAFFTNSDTITLQLHAVAADSVRLSGDLQHNPWAEFRLFDANNQIRTTTRAVLQSGDGLKRITAQFKDLAGNFTEVAQVVLLDTQGPVFFAGAPSTNVINPAANDSIGIIFPRPTDRGGSGVKSFRLYYRRGGENWSAQNVQAFDAGDRVQIPAAFVTTRGVDFQLAAEDSAGNRSILQNGSLDFFSIPVQVRARQLASNVLPGGTKAIFYRLVSLPLWVEDKSVGEAFADLGNSGAQEDFRIWQYQGQESSWLEGPQFALRPGEGYFLIKRQSGSIANLSTAATTKAADAAAGNIPGWHLRAEDWTLIGNPFDFEIDLSSLQLKRSLARLDTFRNVWAYDGQWRNRPSRLEKWSGLALRISGPADTLVYQPAASVPGSSLTLLPAEPAEAQSKLHGTTNENEWLLAVMAESPPARDSENHFGVHMQAQIGPDAFDLYEPPLLPGGLSLSFISTGDAGETNLAADIRPANQPGHEWTLQITSREENAVKLCFKGIDQLPPSLGIFLLDRTSRLLLDLRRQPAPVFYLPASTPTKQLALLVGDRAFLEENSGGLRAVPTTFALRQNYPNPFNPATVIRYELPVAGKVSLRIYNVLGAEILALAENYPHTPGYYEKVVDLSGLASGLYFYRLSIQGEQRFERTRKMVLAR